MGMAASQARFLGLTARQNNVEYEGQQVNQQRTTLANQSANYYNQLLGMSVPVPPSTSDYTKTVYTFEDGNLSNSITALIAQPNGEYLVSYVSSWVDEYTPVANGNAIITTNVPAKTEFKYGAVELREVKDFSSTDFEYNTVTKESISIKDESGIAHGYNLTRVKDAQGNDKTITVEGKTYDVYEYVDGDKTNTVYRNGDSIYVLDEESRKPVKDENITYNREVVGEIVGYHGNDPYFKSLSIDQLNNVVNEEKEYYDMLDKKYGSGDEKTQWFIRYQKNTTTGTFEPIFYNKKVVEDANYSDKGTSQSNIQEYKMGSAPITEEIKNVKARLEKDATGRYINIVMNPDDDQKRVTYALTTNTVTDQARYDDAMNQYEYDKYQYDQSIQEINAKIEIIQAEDKNLELRLKQLDTEQKAIQSEKEAVEKVVQKNVESTFKTFG